VELGLWVAQRGESGVIAALNGIECG